jgi:hypothetical protein
MAYQQRWHSRKKFWTKWWTLEGLLQRRTERVADPDKDVDFELLLKVLSYAQWEPNATNEQPNKNSYIQKRSSINGKKLAILMKKALEERIF